MGNKTNVAYGCIGNYPYCMFRILDGGAQDDSEMDKACHYIRINAHHEDICLEIIEHEQESPCKPAGKWSRFCLAVDISSIDYTCLNGALVRIVVQTGADLFQAIKMCDEVF